MTKPVTAAEIFSHTATSKPAAEEAAGFRISTDTSSEKVHPIAARNRSVSREEAIKRVLQTPNDEMLPLGLEETLDRLEAMTDDQYQAEVEARIARQQEAAQRMLEKHPPMQGYCTRKDLRPLEAVEEPEQEPEQELACTQLGNALRFARRFRDSVRWVEDWKAWVIWTGQKWSRECGKLTVQEQMRQVVDDILREAQEARDRTRKDELVRWALRSQATHEMNAALEQAKSDLRAMSQDFDSDPWLLNCLNGTVDLSTGKLRPHRREDFLTKMTEVDFLPGATSERWENFLRDALPDEETRRFAQKCAGYTTTGKASEDVLLLIYGVTRTGKGTFQGALQSALGRDYATTMGLDDLAETRADGASSGPNIARLQGTRMVNVYETSARLKLAAGLVKTLTGGDPIKARWLYGNPFEFLPQHTIWIASNYRPGLPEDDDAIWKRLREVPFTQQVPEERQDPRLRELLRGEDAPAVLAWMVEGALLWQQEGLRPPEQVVAASLANRDEQDPLRDFFEECCSFDRRAATPTGELREAYERYCQRAGCRSVGVKRFAASLERRGCQTDRTTGGKRLWVGISLNNEVPEEMPRSNPWSRK